MSEMRWHKQSRFWKFGARIVLVSDVLALVALIWRPEVAGAALGAAGAVSTAFLAGAGGTNISERWNPPANGKIDTDIPEAS